MLQLSFAYDKDSELRTQYMTPETGILQQLVRVAHHPKVSSEGRKIANLLKSRLVEPEPEVESEQPIQAASATHSAASSTHSGVKPSHIMISYCWNNMANPGLVKSLASEFRNLGYEVWRDVDGSSLVPAMSGSTEERMAEALEAASVLIICVSKGYKESANCRMEAKYASQLSKKGKIKIFYVMMQREYTTVSEPDSCDGWLGIMIGEFCYLSLRDLCHFQ